MNAAEKTKNPDSRDRKESRQAHCLTSTTQTIDKNTLAFDKKSDYLKRLIFIADMALIVLAYVIAVKAYPYIRPGATLDEGVHFGLLPIIITSFAISRFLLGRSVNIQSQTSRVQIVRILQENSLVLAILVLVIFLLKLETISRAVVISSSVLAVLFMVSVRRFALWWHFSRKSKSTENHLRVLIIGSGRRARMLADQLMRSSEWGVHIVGFLDPKGQSAGRRATDEILGHVDEINRVLRDNVVEDVVVALPRSMLGDVQSIIDACQEEGVRLRFMADIYDFQAANVRLSAVNGIPLLAFEPVSEENNALIAKRALDVAVTLFAMPFVVVVFAIVAAAIRLDSRGPVFFTQVRVGQHKRKFKMYKFRSMVVDAEEKLKQVEHLNEASGPHFKIENDPRMTRVGRFIRKTSIDELPQLFNVLKGDMSLVGPRPMSVRDVNLFDKGLQRKRFSIRPGITCIWQISGRSALTFDEWLEMDLQYIDNWSFLLDLKILLLTMPVVLKRKGAA